MNKLFNALKYIKVNIDDLLIISNGSFEDHINKGKTVLMKLKKAEFNVFCKK